VRPSSTAWLLALALLAGGAALWAGTRPDPAALAPPEGRGEPLLAGLDARRDAVRRIVLRGPAGLVATLERDASADADAGPAWRIVERDGHPADAVKVAALLEALAQVRRVDAKTADPARQRRLGLGPLDAEGARGLHLALEAGGRGWGLRLGGYPPGERGRYVRVDGEDRAWEVDYALDAGAAPGDWIDAVLSTRPVGALEEVVVRPPDGAGEVRLVRGEDGPDGALRFALRPAAPADPARVEALADAPARLRARDVARVDAVPEDAATLHRVRWRYRDGLRVDARLWRRDGRAWLALQAEADAAAAPEAHAEAAALQARWAGLAWQLDDEDARALAVSRTAGAAP
jgi:hypothetical protein